MIYPFRKIVFNCKEATLLSIKRTEGKITLPERLKLSYHLLYCDPCRRFVRQWKRLHGSVGSIDPPLVRLPDEARDRIARAIEDSR